MKDRLGNQLFRYAMARTLQLKFYPNYDLIINTNAFKNVTDQRKQEGFDCTIRDFKIKVAGYTDKLPSQCKTLLQKCLSVVRGRIFYKILPYRLFKSADFNIFHPILNIFGLYIPGTLTSYIKPHRSSSKNILVQGCFEHSAYFDGIRDTLLEEFTPIHDPLPRNSSFLRDITSSDSVCVSIRRGDFLSPKISAEFNVCNEEYFVTAMKAIREEIPGCKFFVFSDDVDDVKRNMHFPFDVTYERGNDPVWEKLRLMYSCRHFIISNSTFSWWAQYLSRNPGKIVYAPIPWLWDGGNGESIYSSYVRTIRCHR
ncbi:MAG: alpha-1,2-fucosyltransferase [Synergistaceae bacterium]|nr:alpha-1,2-fucosyltransferase [Synergistaceae bacterium]